MASTVSANFREKGNKSYRESQTLGRELKRLRLDDAIENYRRAIQEANKVSHAGDLASGYKNLATALFANSQILEPISPSLLERQIFPMLNEACSTLVQAVIFAQSKPEKSAAWIFDVQELASRIVDRYMDLARDHAPSKIARRSWLDRLCSAFGNGTHAHGKLTAGMTANFSLAEFSLNQAVASIAGADDEEGPEPDCVAEALRAVRDASAPLARARLFVCDGENKENHMREIDDLAQRLYFQECMLQSVRERRHADKLLESQLEERESPDEEELWKIADLYKSAIVHTREIDIENEAIASYKLALLYKDVLKFGDVNDPEGEKNMRKLARINFRRVIELGNSLYPRVPTRYEWYNESAAAVAAYQLEDTTREDEAYDKERQPYLDALKDELAEVRVQKTKSRSEFLTFIYKTHPPTDPKKVLGSLLEQDIKKTLKDAVIHYHPDKQTGESFDEKKRKVLYEEITKVLNGFYESVK